MLTFGSLFAGIGGFDLGFERAGMECKWQVEIDDYANKVLAKHWPEVRRWGDVRTWPQPDAERVDVICGGFPCQDLSVAGKQRGLEGERSGLWWEMFRVLGSMRPQWIVIENVPQLRKQGLWEVLSSLSSIGYDAEWQTISAEQFGLAHRRQRLFIVAYTNSVERVRNYESGHAVGIRSEWHSKARRSKDGGDLFRWLGEAYKALGFPADDPATRGAVDGIPNRLDRNKGLGNAIVPTIAEWIGRRIIQIKSGTA